MKIKIFLTLLIVATNINSQVLNKLSNTIPEEKIHLHINSTYLLTGESLLYKFYCNTTDDKPSSISKIAYVELINSEKKVIFKHKLRLKNGKSYGDFIIPSSIKSGNYKLIGYTIWSRNEGVSGFFQCDLLIINPYKINLDIVDTKSLNDSLVNISYKTTSENSKTKGFIEKNKYTNRSKVLVHLNESLIPKGNYSISVRKIDSVIVPKKTTIYTKYKTASTLRKTIKDSFFLPDLRGEVISGKIINKQNNLPVANSNILFSIPGKDFILKTATTNKTGEFYFNLYEYYNNTNCIFNIIDKNKNDYKIILNNNKLPNYDFLSFKNYKIDSTYKKSILQNSINNQIENAYSNIKYDSIYNQKMNKPFFYSTEKTYYLDEYTKFNSVEEYVIELLNEVYIKKSGDNHIFNVRVYDMYTDNDLPVLITIDGNVINNHNDLYYYDPKKIKSISVVKDKYVYGQKIFKGIIYVKTFKGDYQSINDKDYISKRKLIKPLDEKKYFSPNYNISNLKRIPDYRTQLYWNPNINVSDNDKIITFFTSDIKGKFEISIEGYSDKGKPISLFNYFEVN